MTDDSPKPSESLLLSTASICERAEKVDDSNDMWAILGVYYCRLNWALYHWVALWQALSRNLQTSSHSPLPVLRSEESKREDRLQVWY